MLALSLLFSLLSVESWGQTVVSYTTPGSYSWVCPTGVTSVTVQCWGAGGSGGISGFTKAGGAGGGGGAFASSVINVTPGNSYSIVVGAGGISPTSTATTGNTGGQSYFNTPLTVMAIGGSGGGYYISSTSPGIGGNGGAFNSCVGTIRWSGGNGGNSSSTTGNSATSGGGGSSAGTGAIGNNANLFTGGAAPSGGVAGVNGYSSGAAGGAVGTNGNPGGGGGSGSRNSGTAGLIAGNGGGGKIILTFTEPPCSGTPNPGNTVSSVYAVVSGGTVNLSLQNATSGTGITYQWQSSTTSSTAGFSNINGATNSTYVTSLSVSTWFRCVVYCSVSSGISNAVQVLVQPYCAPTGTASYYINNFSTTSGLTNINNSTLSNGGYGNFTSLNVSNIAGSSTGFSISHSATSGGAGVGIWVDWNNDFDFADANEQIALTTAYNYSPFTGSIIVPASTLAGNYRLRIVIDYNSTSPINCPVGISGETEDYIFQVVECTSPSTQTSALTAGTPGVTSANINWTNGNGAGRVVYINSTNSFTNPNIGSNPTVSTAWSNTGQQCIYNGTGTGPVTVTGLSASSTYYLRAFEYCAPDRNYQTATATGNSNSFTTSAPSPTITVIGAPTFSNQCVNTTSNQSSFTVSGVYLTNNVTIGAVTGYTYSTNPAGPYTNSLTFSPTTGTLASTIVYVRFTPTSATTFNGPIVVSSTGATTQNVVVSAAGVNASISSQPSSAAETYCNGTSATALSVTVPSAGGSSYSYQWYSNAANSNSGGTLITNATSASYTPPTTSNGTTYYYCVVSGCGTSTSTSTVSGAINVVSCSSTNIPATGSTNVVCGTNTYIYDSGGPSGDYATNSNGFIVLNNSGNGIITISGSYSAVESCCDDINIYSGSGTTGTLLYNYFGSGNITTYSSTPGETITIQIVSDGSVQGAGLSLLATYSGFPTINNVSPTNICGGGTLTINGSNFSNITGVTINNTAVASYVVNSPTSITAVLTSNQVGGVVAVNSSFCSGISTTGSSVTILPSPTLTSSGSVAPVCTSTSGQITTLSYTATSNSPISYQLDWNAAANAAGLIDGTLTPFSFVVTGGTINIPVAANVVPGVYSGTLNYSNSNGCSGTQVVSLTITPIPTLASVSQQSSLCYTQNVNTNASIQLSGLLLNTAQTATYNINGGTSQTIAFTSSASGTATLSVPVVLANNGQTLSITSINCANFTTNNSCVLSIIQAPTAPSVLPLTQTVNVGASATFTGTRSASANTMTWWTAASGGTEIDPDGPALSVDSVFNSYDAVVLPSTSIDFCTPGLINASTTTYKYYVQQYDGTCPSARTMVQVFTNPLVSSSSSNNLICQTGASVTLTANITQAVGSQIQWQFATNASGTANPPVNNNLLPGDFTNLSPNGNSTIISVSPSVSTTYQLNTASPFMPFGCNVTTFNNTIVSPISTQQNVLVYPSLDFTPVANPSSICVGGTSTLIPNTPNGNFTASCILPITSLSSPPTGVTPWVLSSNGSLATSQTSTPNALQTGVLGTNAALDDGYWSNIPIGFTYNFFGENATTVHIGSNGTVVVGVLNAVGSSLYNFTGGFPNTANPASTIAVCARDLYLSSGSIKYWTEGIAPTRRFIVQYDNVATYCFGCSGGTQSAELTLYETSGVIEIRLLQATNGSSSGSATLKYIGLQDPTKTIGATAPNCSVPNQSNYWNGISDEISSSLAWRFSPPSNYSIDWYQGSGSNLSALVSIPYLAANSTSSYFYSTLPSQSTNSGQITYSVSATNTITGCPATKSVYVNVNSITNPPQGINSSQCGPGIPTLVLNTGNNSSNSVYSWYAANPSLNSSLSTYYSNNFSNNIGVSPSPVGVLSGNASLQGGGFIRLTSNNPDLLGGFTIPASGVNSSIYQMMFDIQTPQTSGADGISYSFANDADASATVPSAENGTGTKLVVSFDEYGSGNGGSGIRLVYGGAADNLPQASGGVVLAYSNNTTWMNPQVFSNVHIYIDQQGRLSMVLNGNLIFNNIQLPNSFVTADKSTWSHVFKARTGLTTAAHRLDNVSIKQNTSLVPLIFNSATYTSSLSQTTNLYTVETFNGCPSQVLPLTVTVNTVPTSPTISVPAPYCQGDPASSLSATGTASNPLNWYLGSLNASPNTIAPTPVTSVAGTTNYLVTQTSTANGCASAPATISVVVNATPSAPAYSSTYSTGTITQCQGTAAISISSAVVASVGGTLYYYTVPTGGTALSFTPNSTPSVAGTTTYYVSQVISGCEGPRAVVTSVVNPTLTASVALNASTVSVCSGGAITFTATPTNGGTTPSYQWFLNNPTTPISGQTGATYTLASPASGDQVFVKMTSNPAPNCLNPSTSPATSNTITLNTAPATPVVNITQSTPTTTVCSGTSVTFSVATSTALGSNPTYQWLLNGTPISGATAATLTTTTLINNNVVSLIVTSSIATNCLTQTTATSAGISMTVTPLTTITTQPIGASVCQGATPVLSSTASGTGTLTYQWQSCTSASATTGTNLSSISYPTALTTSLTTPAAGATPGYYRMVATGTCGSATSAIATISINTPTAITTPPTAQAICTGTTATFTTVAQGQGTISYQWLFNGSALSGATNASYSIPNLAASNAGQYSVAVTATCGTVTSSAVQLIVNPLTTISVQPIASTTVCDSTLLNLSVSASGTAPISYQWYRGNTAITSATLAQYSDPTTVVAEAGQYTVQVTGGCSIITSTASTVVVLPKTWITTQPVSYTGCALNPTSLSVTGLGANVQYQWSLGSNPSTAIPGATSSTYNLSNPQTSNSGSYTVTLTGANNGQCGTQTSNIALVTINPVPSAGTITGGNSGVCVGSTINLTNLASGGVWTSSNPLMGSISSTGVLTGVSAGTITVTYTVTNSFGCVSTATKVIQVKGLPTALIQTPLATSICQGEAMNLQSSAAVSYAWSNGATSQNIAVNSSATGTVNYTVTVTGTNACTATSAPVAITVIPVPTIAAINGTGNYPNFCLGNTSNLTNATANGIWSSSNTNVLTVNPLSGAANTLTIGTATVSYHVANIPGCLNPNPGTATATITVSTPPAAFITPSGSTTFCQGGSVTLTAPSGVGYNYLWSNGATTQSITATTSGSYSLTVTATGGCSVTSLPTTVTVLPIPTATIYPTGAINICSGTNVTLSTGSAVSYVWSNGAITPTVSVNTSGTYSVTLTGTNGCTVTSAVSTVTVTPVPSAVITANGPTNICDGGSVGLSVPTAGSYLWSNGATTQGISATSTGNYSVTATNGICSATSTPVYVNFNPVPSSTVTASGPTTFCQGGNVTLTAATGNSFTYLWSNGATTQSITVAASGTYSVTVSNSFNCSSTSTPISVVVNALPTASITAGGSTTICSGNSLSLTATSANAYLWSTGATTQSINVSVAGNYTVEAISAAGCTATSSVLALNVLPSPTAIITQASGTTFCQGGSVVINSTPASAYLWSNSETTQAISATTTGVYSVLVTAANGCTATSNAINVNVLPTPTATIYPGTNVNICAGSTVTLSTGTAASYVWSNGAITPTITVSANGTHSVTLTGSNGCTATSALTTVTVNPIPVAAITATGTTNICSGTSVNLTATAAGSYLWSNGATTQTIAASLAGAYTVTVTTAGCSATSASTTVNVNQSPTANVTASGPTSFCQGGSVSFTANAGNGYSYLWSNGATTASISTSTSGNNSVTVTNLIGCSTTSAVNAVVVNPIPVATITAGGSTTICSGSPVSLSAPAGANYLWNTGATTQSINAATAGNYTVVVTTAAGCSATSVPTTITVNALPSAAISSNGSTTFCQGGTVGLSANSGMTSYQWSNGDTGQSINAGNSGSYSVVVTDANGCSATSNLINVNVNPAPTATIFPGTNVTICSGSSVTLSTNSAVSYNWSTGAITPTIQVNASGTYSVTLTGSNGCSATSPVTTVAVTTTPTAAITASGPTTICQGSNVSLSAPAAANSYLWNTGATTQTITASLVGSYFVTVGSNGCSATSPSTFVSYNPVPSAAVTASGPTTFCLGNSVSFSAPAGNGNSYLWNTGATTQSVSTSTPGTFSVTVTNGYGCSASSAVNTVLVNPLPVVTPITGSSSICAGTQGQVSNVMTGGVYASSNLGVASIGQLNGQITGLTAGNSTISYIYTDVNGCSNTVTYPVTITAAPVATISAGGPTTFCQGGSVTLTASSGTAYAWSNGATTASITVSASGSFSVSVTGANGCSASSQVTTVNVLTPSPVSAINGANSVCVNSATSFTNATSGGTWSTSNPLIATVSTAGNVTGVSAGSATITYAINSTNGCQNAATKVVTVNAVPATALTASGATTFCQGSNVSLTASTGSTYLWSTGATTSSITASTSGTYNVTVTNANGCSSVSTNQLITVNANPTASISTNGSTNLCTGGSIVLMATPNSSYVWNTGATTSSITATTAGSYSVTVTNANGCSATSTATSVVVNASPSATVTASGPTTICSGSNVVLSATAVAGNTYQWSNNGVLISGATSASYTATTSGTYAVTVTNASGCSATSTTTPVSVVLATAATITPSGSTSLCNNASVTLTATSGASYLWSNGATTQAITVNTAANYTVTVTNALGCSATSVATPVLVNTSPTATITAAGPTTFCQGGNVVLTASSGASYVWSNGATTASITASTPGSYSVLITNASGCAATAAATAVTVNAAPNAAISAGGSTTFCSGGSVTLTASAGASYLWSTGATTASISVNTAGARTVTVTNAAGCSSTSAATTIVVNATPTASITAGGSTTICSGSTVTLTASAGSSYAWSNGATTASIVANTTGNYTVTVFNANGCSAISTPTTVTVNNPSVANISTSGSTNFCQGGSVVLTATAASTYAWSTGATTQAITVSASGNYSVTLTNASGCTSTSPVTAVTSNALPTATITAGGATTFCQGGSVTLTASPATSYVWSNGATSASITVSTAGSYTVQVANNAGCVSTSAATAVSVNALPTATITAAGSLSICAGSTVNLTASTGAAYLWSNGATTATIAASNAGNYSVQVTNAAGCISTSAVSSVVVNALPTPSISSVGSTTICQGATVTLTTANGPGLTYQWKNNGTNIAGANGASYVANAAGIYTVQVTNAAGCSGTSTASAVVVNALPVASISNSGSTTICAGSSVNLTASAGTAYAWSNGATTASIAVNATGNYTVSITNAAGCTSSASTAITVVTPTVASITANGPTSFCAGQNVTLTANPGASYVWSTGATTASIAVSTTSNPTVQVTYANGCSSTSAIMPITVNALPAASITANGATSFCPGATVTLTASAGSSYAWTNGATTNSIIVSASGSYGVSVTNASGCVATAVPTAITVFAVPTASITTSGATTFCQGSTLSLTANAGASYVWSSGETTSSISTGVSGNYSVTVFNANGCSAVSSIVPVTVNANPVATIQANGPTTVCQGSTVLLTSNGGTGFTWTNSETTASISVTTSGSYGVTVTNAAGCSTTVNPVAVTVNPVQVLSPITGANSVCVGATTTYANTTSGGTWSSDNTAVASVNSTSGIVSGVSSGSATIKYQFVNASGCTSEVTKVVTVNTIAPVSISASSATSFCQGGSVTLTAPAGLNYNWTNSQTTQSITVSTSGAYALAVSNAAGCFTTSSTVQVTVNPAPTVAISSASTTICQGTTLVLNAPSNAVSYAWSNGATTQSVVIASAGTYSLTITDANGCSASTNTTIVNGINPQAAVSAGGATTFCQGGNVVLNAAGGTSFLWNNGATTQNITVTTPGNYSVLVTNAAGCSATSNSMFVNVLQSPTSTITAYGPTTFCQGGSVTLATTGAASYAWSNSATSQSIVPTTSGTYSVVVTGANGCTATSNAINVTVNPIPTAVITPSGATIFCEGSSVNLVASGGVSYAWNNGSTATTLAATTGGVYTVTVTNAGGCTDTETLTVTVNEVPSAFIVTSGSTTFCQGGEVSLTAQAGNSYVWSNNATTQSIAVTTAGTYSVSILSPNGCSVTSNAITVDVNQPSSSNLIATAFDGYTLNGILYTQSGTYTQTLTNAAGCDSTIILELTLTVGIEEGTLTDVSLYPNPTSESFTVKTSIPVYGSYSVVDAQGKLVFEGEMTGTETHVNISSVARGIYYLRIPELSEPLRVVKN